MKSAFGANFWMVTVSGTSSSNLAQPSQIEMKTGLCVPSDCNEQNLRNGLDSIFIESGIFAGIQNPSTSYANMIEF